MSTLHIVTLLGAAAVIALSLWVIVKTYREAMDDWERGQDRIDKIGRGRDS